MSANTVREFVKSTLTEKDRRKIITNMEQFERDGFIGECDLRRATDLFKSMNHIPVDANVVMWMNLMATEVYRYYALQHLGLDNSSTS